MKSVQPMHKLHIYDTSSLVTDSLVWLLESYHFVCHRFSDFQEFISTAANDPQSIVIVNQMDLPKECELRKIKAQLIILVSKETSWLDDPQEQNIYMTYGENKQESLISLIKELLG